MLEHVDDVQGLLQEAARVVRVGGVAVHLMPTSSWRFWTSVNHYLWLLKAPFQIGGKKAAGVVGATARRGWGVMLSKLMFAQRHGEHGSALSELWHFSRRVWRRRLSRDGWELNLDVPVGISYTGYFVTWPLLGLRTRSRASRVFGSGCSIYILKRTR